MLLSKRSLLELKKRNTDNDKEIMKQFENFEEFLSSEKFSHSTDSNLIKIDGTITFDCTLDAIKTYRDSGRYASHHTQFSIKQGGIKEIALFHEGKESMIILDELEKKGFFDDVNKVKYYFVNNQLFEIKWRSPNDIPGLCVLCGVNWRLRKIDQRFTWEHCLPTLIFKNNRWRKRFGEDGRTFNFE